MVLNNSIGSSFGKLPDNVVVVAAGNSKEESEAAYNMPEPLFRRFSGHIELKPNIQEFLEWGSQPHSENPERNKIHPIVSAFVASFGNDVLYSEYDPENPPKYAIDPRAWEQVSDIIYDNKGTIARELLVNKLGDEVAASFIEFAKMPPITLQDILKGEYLEEEIPSSFDEQYALMLSLSRCSEEYVEIVKEFIWKYLPSEIDAIFDSVWVGSSDERAILISNINGMLSEYQKNN